MPQRKNVIEFFVNSVSSWLGRQNASMWRMITISVQYLVFIFPTTALTTRSHMRVVCLARFFMLDQGDASLPNSNSAFSLAVKAMASYLQFNVQNNAFKSIIYMS